MFRLIGIIVVVAAFMVGYSSLHKWYEGKATPEETVVNLRDQLGTAIKPKADNSSPPENTSRNEDPGKAAEKSNDTSDFSTENAARELIKHSND